METSVHLFSFSSSLYSGNNGPFLENRAALNGLTQAVRAEPRVGGSESQRGWQCFHQVPCRERALESRCRVYGRSEWPLA